MAEWLTTLISVVIGGLIGFLSSIGAEFWRNKKTEEKIRASVLGEIRANLESARNSDRSSLLWVDDVYKANLDKLGCFKLQQLELIVRFYAKVAQYRDRITRQYEEHLKQEERNRQLGVSGDHGVFERTILMLASEIEKIGNQILNRQ